MSTDRSRKRKAKLLAELAATKPQYFYHQLRSVIQEEDHAEDVPAELEDHQVLQQQIRRFSLKGFVKTHVAFQARP